MKITLKDIAKETGYSISTVSRVLNGSDKISTKARKKIFKSARRLNYPLQTNGNGRISVETLKIFLIVSGYHMGEFYTSFFYGLNRAAEEKNIRLSLISVNKPFKEMAGVIMGLLDHNYDGMILFTPELTTKEYNQLKKILPDQYPVVSNGLIENPVFNTVTFDGYSGGFLAAEHFKKKGYVKCGIIKGPFEKAEARYRSNGFRDYIIQQPGMDVTWEFKGDFSFESGIKAYEAFKTAQEKPRAIFACNDEMSHAFMEAALLDGYTFPHDIAIVSFDDLPICSRHRPTISSIHTSYKKLGTVTMETLREMITNPLQQQGVLSLVPVKLKQRESS